MEDESNSNRAAHESIYKIKTKNKRIREAARN